MRLCFAFVFSVLCLHLSAQLWNAPGASWYYSYNTATTTGYQHLVYQKDTMYGPFAASLYTGTTYFTIDGSFVDSFEVPRIALGVIEDTVYMIQNSNFEKFYVFNLPAGDTLHLAHHTGIIDTAGTMLVGAQTRRFYKFHIIDSCTNGAQWPVETVIEGVGDVNNNLLPTFSCDNVNHSYSLRCYGSNGIPQVGFTNISCDALLTGISQTALPDNIKLRGNPVNDNLQIETGQPLQYHIYNALGAELKQGQYLPNESLNVTALPNGLYLLHLQSGQQTKTLRFVKE